jgi:hypothetical protein
MKTKITSRDKIYAVEDRAPRVYPWMNEPIQSFTRKLAFQCEWLVGQRPKQQGPWVYPGESIKKEISI